MLGFASIRRTTGASIEAALLAQVWGSSYAVGTAMPGVLISIKPRYLDAILSGRKTVELRKRSTRIPTGTRLLLYASSPRCAVVGEARVGSREELSIEDLWVKHGVAAAVTREELDAYYAGAEQGVVLGLLDVRRYPVALPLSTLRDASTGFRPPQSYMRAPAFLDALLRRLLGGPYIEDVRALEEQGSLLLFVPAE